MSCCHGGRGKVLVHELLSWCSRRIGYELVCFLYPAVLSSRSGYQEVDCHVARWPVMHCRDTEDRCQFWSMLVPLASQAS